MDSLADIQKNLGGSCKNIKIEELLHCKISADIVNFTFFFKVKLLKWECNTSKITVTNIRCRSRSLTRYHQVADLQFEVKERVQDIQVS